MLSHTACCFNPQLVPFAPDCNERKWPLKDKSGILNARFIMGLLFFICCLLCTDLISLEIIMLKRMLG